MKSACGLLLSIWILPCNAELAAQTIAVNCLSCHETDAEQAGSAIPGLQDLSPAELLQALLDFKYDRKSATLMPRIAKGYSDAELAGLAEFLSRR